MLFVLMAGAAVAALVQAFANNKALAKKLHAGSYLPKGISLLLLTAQASEIVRVVEHTTPVHVVIALMLLAIVAATKSGTEDSFH